MIRTNSKLLPFVLRLRELGYVTAYKSLISLIVILEQ